MQSIEYLPDNKVRITTTGLPDIPRSYTIIFKTSIQGEEETIALTEKQALKIMDSLDKGATGVRIGNDYWDKWLIKRIISPKDQSNEKNIT